jgi:hypothetical protein
VCGNFSYPFSCPCFSIYQNNRVLLGIVFANIQNKNIKAKEKQDN